MTTRSSNPDLLPGLEPSRRNNGRRGSDRLQHGGEPENPRSDEELEVQEDREAFTYPPRAVPGEYQLTPIREPSRGGDRGSNGKQAQGQSNQEIDQGAHKTLPLLPRSSEIRKDDRSQSRSEGGNEDSAYLAEDESQQERNRELRERMEPLGTDKRNISLEQKSPVKYIPEREIQQHQEMEGSSRHGPSSKRGIQQQIMNNSMLTLLNKIEEVNNNVVEGNMNIHKNLHVIHKNTHPDNNANLYNAINSSLKDIKTTTESKNQVMSKIITEGVSAGETIKENYAQNIEKINDVLQTNEKFQQKLYTQIIQVESSLKEEILKSYVPDQSSQIIKEINNLKQHMNNQLSIISTEISQIKRDMKNKITNNIPITELKEDKEEPTNMDSKELHQILKILPPVADWPKFSGEGEYDHISFIKYIDHMLSSYKLPGSIALMRLPRLFEGVALDWFVTKSENKDIKDWDTWKTLIKDQFGTRLWKKKMIKIFESDFFDPLKDKPHKWCLQQKKRLDCAYPNLDPDEVNERILGQCKGSLEHDIKCRLNINEDLTHLISIMEEVVESKNLKKKYKDNCMIKTKIEKELPKVEEPLTTKRAVPECYNCGEKGHKKPECLNLRKKINLIDVESGEEDSGSQFDLYVDNPPEMERHMMVIEGDIGSNDTINTIQGEAYLPQEWNDSMDIGHVSDAKMILNKPEEGKNYTMVKSCYTWAYQDSKKFKILLDIGAFCSCTSQSYLENNLPEWRQFLLPLPKGKFSSCTSKMEPLGIIPLKLIFPHTRGSVRMNLEFVVMKEAICDYLIIGNDTFTLYGIDFFQSKGRYFTIGGDWKRKFSINNINAVITDKEEIKFQQEYFSQANINSNLQSQQVDSLLSLCHKNQDAFCTSDHPIGNVQGHDLVLKLNTEYPYPPVLRRPAYPASPKSKIALEEHVKELINLGVLRKVGHNEQVGITTPVIIAWHNDKSRMVGDFRALNKYTAPDYYPIPRIDHSLHNLSKAKYISTMDILKGFHQIPIAEDSRKYLRIICHMGIFEYLRMPFGIRNAPSHFQRMMDSIFGDFIRQGWVIIYIDDIIIYSDTWEEHLSKIQIILQKAIESGLKISIKKCSFGYAELKALGHIVSRLSLAIDQNKVAAIMQKEMPQTKKEMMSFLGFCSYYRQHIPNFANITKNLYELCNKDTVFEMTYDRVKNYEKMKLLLTSAPVLAQPDYSKPFQVYIDAC